MATFKRVGTIKHFETNSSTACASAATTANSPSAASSQIEGLRRIRLSRKPRRELRQSRLCLGLDQMPLPRRVRGRAAQQPADGLLCAGADRARRAGARRRGAAGRRQPVGLGLHAGEPVRAPRSALHPRHAEHGGRHPHHACAAARLPPDQRLFRRRRQDDRKRPRPRLRFRPRSLAAHRLQPAALEKLARRRRLPLARPRPPRCAVGGARAAALRRQGRPAAVRARRHAGARARRRSCRRCCRASRWSRITAICICR